MRVAIESKNGSLLRVVSPRNSGIVEYHHLFGFISESAAAHRRKNRRRHGFTRPVITSEFKFAFSLQNHDWAPIAVSNCEIKPQADHQWTLTSEQGEFRIRQFKPDEIVHLEDRVEEDNTTIMALTALLFFFLFVGALNLLSRLIPEEQAQVVEQTTVQIAPEVRKTVTVVPESLKTQDVKQQDQIKKAMRQSMGFLGLLGRKDLNKAVGGAPTHLKDASPGAGFGGKEGSGGEELYVGMGQGLQHATIGNTGVAGLGGIGTKGAGGGQGGYGNNAIGGPGGKSLASGPLSQDIVLEGGLDASVVNATIAKYLSQVRACYETGLARNSGLGGFVRVNFEIGSAGNLNYSHVKDSTLGDPEVEQCITQRMMGWKFPNPRGGVNVKVTYPFLLRSARS